MQKITSDLLFWWPVPTATKFPSCNGFHSLTMTSSLANAQVIFLCVAAKWTRIWNGRFFKSFGLWLSEILCYFKKFPILNQCWANLRLMKNCSGFKNGNRILSFVSIGDGSKEYALFMLIWFEERLVLQCVDQGSNSVVGPN